MKTQTLFSILCQRCGLDQRAAADFLDVSLDSVRGWGQGRRDPHPGIIQELVDLYDRMVDRAEWVVDLYDAAGPDSVEIELGITAYDHEALKVFGWPSVGAHAAVLGMIAVKLIAMGHVVKIVPRESTVADAHRK